MPCDFSSGWLEFQSLLTSFQFSNSVQPPVQHGLLVAAILPSLMESYLTHMNLVTRNPNTHFWSPSSSLLELGLAASVSSYLSLFGV